MNFSIEAVDRFETSSHPKAKRACNLHFFTSEDSILLNMVYCLPFDGGSDADLW